MDFAGKIAIGLTGLGAGIFLLLFGGFFLLLWIILVAGTSLRAINEGSISSAVVSMFLFFVGLLTIRWFINSYRRIRDEAEENIQKRGFS